MNLAPTSMAPAGRRSHKWHWVGGVALALAGAVVLLALLWDWNWLRPLAEARASAAIGRKVTMDSLELHPGRTTVIVAHGLRISNPDGVDGPDLATVARLGVTFDVETWLRTSRIVLPLIEADQPVVTLRQTLAGQDNWTITLPTPDPDVPADITPPVQIGDVVVTGGTADVIAPRANADVTLSISTGDLPRGGVNAGSIAAAVSDAGRALIIEAKGSYLNQPITAHLVGGAMLMLRESRHYPVDFSLASGATRITLKGTIRDPLNFAGADLRLMLSGPDMALLYPLTGIPTPPTPPYQVSGKLDFGHGRYRFSAIEGRVGSSDLTGELELDPHGARKILSGTLTSHLVDMADLGGFIGSQPGRVTTPGQSPQQVEDVKRAEADPQLLPTRRISIPKIRSTDIHITYRGDKILGKNMPFDSIATKLDIDDGRIRLTPLRLGISGGDLTGTFDLNPVGDELDASTDMRIEHVNIAKLLAMAGLGDGTGSISGTARLKGRGASLAAIVGHGNGAIDVTMPGGGNVTSVVLDLAGLQLGRAVLSALGVPDKEAIRCMVADLDLDNGILATRKLELDTSEHIVTGGGRIDTNREVVEMYLRTDAKHLSIGTLATPIRISGPFKDLSFTPSPELAVRGVVAVGLGILFPPAALLPSIQFGVGEHSPCADPAK